MESLAKLILEITIFSSIMIIIVLAIKALWQTKINLYIISFLWILVLVRLIVPITISSPVHVDSLFTDAEKAPIAQPQPDDIDNTDNNLDTYFTNTYYEGVSPSNEMYSSDYSLPSSTKQQENILDKVVKQIKLISVWEYIFAIWMLGMCLVLFINIYIAIKFNINISKWKSACSYEMNEIFENSKRQINIKRHIRVMECKYVSMPLTLGFFKPKILIPTGFENIFGREKMRLIITHELYHIKRNDILKNYLWLFAKAVHWFNPLVWIAYKEYVDDIELAVDNMILNNGTKSAIYEYSQSIIDVIRLSNKACKVPLALSFCQDKNKLRKRIKNMIKPQKKLKSAGVTAIVLAIIMIVGCFTTACQPTPENLVVENKNDGELEEAIMETAAPTEPTETEEPKIIVQDTSSNESNTVTVEINAEVINNQPDNIPVVKIEPKEFTEDEVKQMVQAFFGNTQLYSRGYTKEDYDNRIINLQYMLSNDEELLKSDYADTSGTTDIAEIRAEYQELLEIMIEKRESAPEIREQADFSEFDSFNGLNALIDTGKGFMGNVKAGQDSVVLSAFNDDNNYYMPRAIVGGMTTEIELDNDDTEYQNAKNMAVDLINQIGIDSTVGTVYLANDSSDRQYYVFCFEMKINETSLDHTLETGNLSYAKDEVYESLREYERLEVWIENDQLVQLRRRMPMEITEVLNENVAINIDYAQAVELAKQHAYVKFVDTYGYFTEAKLNINKIELIMVRTKEIENGDYIVVPAWNFCGTLSKKYKPELIERQGGDENGWVTYIGLSDGSDTLITVNALDGTIIDMAHGY